MGAGPGSRTEISVRYLTAAAAEPASVPAFAAGSISAQVLDGHSSHSKDYYNFTCDQGTGLESNTKYADSIHFFAGETLYIGLFIASQLDWSQRAITVRQDIHVPRPVVDRG